MSLPSAPNSTWTLREDFRTNQNQLLQMGMEIFDLIDGQTTAERAGRIQEAAHLSSLWDRVAAQYKEKSESMVRELEERRVENRIWTSLLNPTPPVVEGAQTVEPPPDTRDLVSQPVHISTREFPMPPERARARGNVARRIAHPDASLAVIGEPREVTVTLMWHSDKSYRTRVLVGDPIRGQSRLASNLKWPDSLLIEPAWHAMHQDKFQQWLKEHKPMKVRLQAAAGTEKHEFDKLIEWLRRHDWYAAAGWVTQGGDPSTTDLLLTPCGTSLLGALFPVYGMPESAKSQLQRLDPAMDPMASCSDQLQTPPPNWNAAAVQHQQDAYMQERQLPAQWNQQPTLPRGHAETTGYGDAGMNTGQFDGNGPFNLRAHRGGEQWP